VSFTERPGVVRQFTVAAEPNFTTPYGLAIVGSAARWGVSSGTYGAEVDAIGFAFRNPEDRARNEKDLAFYMGAFTASGQWTPSTAQASATAAFAELVATYSSVSGYWERDGKPGFSWALGQPLYCNNGLPAGTTDCIEAMSVKMLSDSRWTPISISNMSCPTTYTGRCRVFAFTTSTTESVNPLFSIAIKLASEPVLLGGVRVEPHYSKIDITINYPWASLNVTNGNQLKLLLIGAYAGKAGTFGVRAAKVDGASAILFTGSSQSAYFSWDGQARIAGVNRPVYALGISGTSIVAYQCTGCDIWSAIVLNIWKAYVTIWQNLGWSVQFVAFSWADSQTASMVWDPVMGVTTTSSNVVIDAASPLAPSIVLAAAVAVFAAMF